MKYKTILLILLICSFVACQKKMLNLAEADKPADAPEYTIKADLNTPGGVEAK